ncbi:MAG: hypothetical protein ABJB76_10145 [Candidatus Nitrosocosmicus sp.]
MASRVKENEQRKGRPTLSLPEFLNIAAACHRTRVPTSIPTIRRLSKHDVGAYKETSRDNIPICISTLNLLSLQCIIYQRKYLLPVNFSGVIISLIIWNYLAYFC